MKLHCAGVTGVIESRLPRFRVTMSASSGQVRISSRGNGRVFRSSFTSTSIQRGSSLFALGS